MSNESKTDLEQRLAKLEERVETLERITMPFNTGIADPVKIWPPIPQNDIGKKCSKCGLKLDQIMSYSCATPGCQPVLGRYELI